MEYTVLQMEYPYEMEYMVVLGRGVICKNITYEYEANYIANALNKQAQELATAKAALDAQSQALADARNFIRDFAALEEYIEFHSLAFYIKAGDMRRQWDSVADETEESESQE